MRKYGGVAEATLSSPFFSVVFFSLLLFLHQKIHVSAMNFPLALSVVISDGANISNYLIGIGTHNVGLE